MADDTTTDRAGALARAERVHIVGIGGAGMSAIASVLAAMGHRVSGSDLKRSPVTERLVSQGIEVHVGHDGAHVADADAVTFSPAVPPSNPELLAAADRGIPAWPRSSVLAAIAASRRCVGVAGTHGKTTTASMLSLILVEAGLRPSFLVGADVNEVGSNAVWDEGEWLVLEADESYGTFVDLSPEIGVVNNLEPDHLDHYGSFSGLVDAFDAYLDATTGVRLVGADDPAALALGRRHDALGVGQSPDAAYRVHEVGLARSSVTFALDGPAGPLGRIDVPTAGIHNVRNAAMAAASALCIGAPFSAVAAALARFTGVPRRFEFRGEANGVTFVDDYAHLPGEVRVALDAARAGAWHRVVAVFQPHRYTRTAALAGSFAGAFADADVLVVTDVYGAGERPVPGVSGSIVLDAVAAGPDAPEVHYAPTREQLRAVVGSLLEPGDVCLTLGAGDLTTLPDELLAAPTW
jgi:UDP-N-acetylmuramate--alanine ligase